MGWDAAPQSIARDIARKHRLLCLRLALDIDSRLVLATPVKSGRARSNWLASVDEPRREIVEPRTDDETLAEAVAVVDRAKEYPLIYITNNLPYIQRLNEGSSKQAPAAFVETAIDGAMQPLVAAGFLK
ncbi:hypothetical protein [Nevskia sp.]|uniref:hypothetical protein n=1 Tax=Nevskia sp. TaxID=1929292 RepID=UPI0025F0D852|nr:hypothetical protein [Nevskia sp.]